MVVILAADGAVGATVAQAAKALTILMAAGHGPEQPSGNKTSSDVKTDQKPAKQQKSPESQAQQKAGAESETLKPTVKTCEAVKVEKANIEKTLPLDKRLWTPEQIKADEGKKSHGKSNSR